MSTASNGVSTPATLAVSDGGRLAYVEQGEGSPILLIHGTGGAAWFGSAARLARTHRVITFDRRGFGDSTGEPGADYLGRHVDDAAQLMRQLKAAPATVVGHSWGGIVALGLAARHPELVDRLVLMEPVFHAKKHPTPRFLLAFLRIQLLRKVKGAETGTVAFLRFASRRIDGGTSFDRLPMETRAQLTNNAAGTMAELDAGTGETLSEARVADIKVPVLLLEGAVSQRVFRKLSSRLARTLPQAQVQVLPGASHLMQFDAPADVERAVLSVAG